MSEFQEIQDQTKVANDQIRVGETDFYISDLTVDDTATQLIITALNNNEADIRREYEAKLAAKDAQIQALQLDKDNADNQVLELQRDKSTLQFELSEAHGKRDAAMQKLDDAQAEIGRLNGELEDLRKEIAVGAANAPKVIEIKSQEQLDELAKSYRAKLDEERKRKAEEAEAAKPRIYNVTPNGFPLKYYTATMLDTDEVVTIPWLDIGKYKQIEDTEAARFREELAAAEAEKEAELIASIPVAETPSEPVTPQVPQFPYDETTQAQPTDGLDEEHLGEPAQGTSDSPVTREEFEALKAEVYEIKDKLAKPQPAVWAS